VKCYGLYDGDEIVGFMAIIFQPTSHRTSNNNYRRVHRLVILPDYQGIGLGRRFLEFMGDYYQRTYDAKFTIVTSAKNLVKSLQKSGNWILTSQQLNKRITSSGYQAQRRQYREGAVTYSFRYKRRKDII